MFIYCIPSQRAGELCTMQCDTFISLTCTRQRRSSIRIRSKSARHSGFRPNSWSGIFQRLLPPKSSAPPPPPPKTVKVNVVEEASPWYTAIDKHPKNSKTGDHDPSPYVLAETVAAWPDNHGGN